MISRRKIWALFTGVIGLAAMRKSVSASTPLWAVKPLKDLPEERYFLAQNFKQLADWLDRLPDQHDGNPMAINDATGLPYIEFSIKGIARPGDEGMVERHVAGVMAWEICNYLNKTSGPIYWRARLECEVGDHQEIVHYDPNGPDKDYITDRRCFMDRNWRRIGCYCRLVRGEKLS